MLQTLPTPVVKYLAELERSLKNKVGVVPEDALGDAREHLERSYREYLKSNPNATDQEVYRNFQSSYGEPEDVAQQFEDALTPIQLRLPGYAPGWRIACTRCGRSAPASAAGITRIGAYSRHKYVVGWCRDCRWLRWLSIEKDLDRSNLTHALGTRTTPEELRTSNHRPWTLVAAIVASVLLINIAVHVGSRIVNGLFFPAPPTSGTFAELPPGWRIVSHYVAPQDKTDEIGKKLGDTIVHLTNSVIADGSRQLQINEIVCRSPEAAGRIRAALAKLHANPRDCVQRNHTVFEFVCRTPESARFAAEARYRLPIQPAQITYRVQFDAAPLASAEPMAWNRLFNLFLNWESSRDRRAMETQIGQLATRFEFSNRFILKRSGLGAKLTDWSFSPEPIAQWDTHGGESRQYEFADVPMRAGVPAVRVVADVCCETFATAATDRGEDASLLAANAFWPAGAPRIAELAHQLTGGEKSDQAKIDALLNWFADSKNIRFAGETGSRYGTLTVLSQGYGHCWDYSDLFVTLCRASGIRSRQVIGWLHGGAGHAWAEVMLDGAWHAYDPTTGARCGSDYIPLVISEDGTIPMVYVSAVQIDITRTEN